MEEKISIVVPIYNVEKYLKKCIESIINQTYKNLEIILVNDGSTDNSYKICEEYAGRDKRIKVINKENGGLSDARNAGLRVATGEYISFIDSDDYIELDMIYNLYQGIMKNNADICCCGKVLEYDKNDVYVNNTSEFCVDNVEALKKMLIGDNIDNSACDKLFKIDLFKEIKFPINRYFEDIATVYKLFIKAKKIVHIKNLGYHYVIRKNSISTEKFSNKQFDALFFTKEMTENIVKLYPELMQEANAFLFLEYITTMRKIKRSENAKEFKNEYGKIKKEFNKNIVSILKNKYIPFYKKCMAILVFLNLFSVVEIFYNCISRKK